MTIKLLEDTMWSDILSIQAEVYAQVEPECLEVLKSKWSVSPNSCFVYEQNNKIVSYLLAHAWNSDIPPKLFQALPEASKGSILFLHDLAVSSRASNIGLGSMMVGYLVDIAKSIGFKEVRLVSVQDTAMFWYKQGFSEIPNVSVCSSYGDDAKMMNYAI